MSTFKSSSIHGFFNATKEFAMARSIHAHFPTFQRVASAEREPSQAFDSAKPMAGMLFAAVLAALLVVADQMIETWADGHLLLVWVALWTVAFIALAILAPPLRQLANAVATGASRWSQARAERRADEAMWAHAQTDARIMGDIRIAKTRSQFDA